jgi:hypothetical protein
MRHVCVHLCLCVRELMRRVGIWKCLCHSCAGASAGGDTALVAVFPRQRARKEYLRVRAGWYPAKVKARGGTP